MRKNRKEGEGLRGGGAHAREEYKDFMSQSGVKRPKGKKSYVCTELPSSWQPWDPQTSAPPPHLEKKSQFHYPCFPLY